LLLYPSPHMTKLERTRDTQCARERPTSFCEIEALSVLVNIRASAREPTAGVRHQIRLVFSTCHGNSEQLGLYRPASATYARTYRHVPKIVAGRAVLHEIVYPSSALCREPRLHMGFDWGFDWGLVVRFRPTARPALPVRYQT
jgi:hypothetical protein